MNNSAENFLLNNIKDTNTALTGLFVHSVNINRIFYVPDTVLRLEKIDKFPVLKMETQIGQSNG
jgi:hypothetical protein